MKLALELLSRTTEILGLHEQNAELTLRKAHIDNYATKLKPLFTPGYFETIDSKDNEEPLPKTAKYLGHALTVPLVTITNLHVQPGEKHFVLWLCVSSYFPLILACLAPLGNLISLIGLIEHWRVEKATGTLVSESKAARVLNILAFVFGIIGNVSLLMNFTGFVRYLITQSVSIICWIVAASMLLIAVLLTNSSFVGDHVVHRRSEGFWLAVWTIFMYYTCSIIQTINLFGYNIGKYPASYNLDRHQRRLINYTMVFAVWQAVGAVVMKHLIRDISYGASLYYCVVSVFTVGLGDIHPISTAAKIVALVFAFVGIVNLGMVVTTISRVVINSAAPSIFWHQVEVRRKELLRRWEKLPDDPMFHDSFRLMRDIRERVLRRQVHFNRIASLIFFVGFWQIGSAVFHAAEDWTYFNLMYFCFLCLLTIGYGDFAPKTVFGRAFFIQWAMGAVPLMTIIISTAGDAAFNTTDRLERMTRLIFKNTTDDSAEAAEEPHIESGSSISLKYPSHSPIDRILINLDLLQEVVVDALEEPTKRYDPSTWRKWHAKTLKTDEIPESFWLEESSPLRLPLNEPHYLLVNMFYHMRLDIERLKKEGPFFDQGSNFGRSRTVESSDCTGRSKGRRLDI